MRGTIFNQDVLGALELVVRGARHDPADGEHLLCPGAATGDHHAREDLDPLFVAFQNLGVHIDRVPGRGLPPDERAAAPADEVRRGDRRHV